MIAELLTSGKQIANLNESHYTIRITRWPSPTKVLLMPGVEEICLRPAGEVLSEGNPHTLYRAPLNRAYSRSISRARENGACKTGLPEVIRPPELPSD